AAGKTPSFAGVGGAESPHLGEVGGVDSHRSVLSRVEVLRCGLHQRAPVRPRDECFEGRRRRENLAVRVLAPDELHSNRQAIWGEAGRYGDCREAGVARWLGEPMEVQARVAYRLTVNLV